MEVKCGTATGKLYINKYKSQGRSPCVLHSSKWHSLTQFQEIGGRASSRNWKKSISHRGQPLQKFVEWLNANQPNPNSQSLDSPKFENAPATPQLAGTSLDIVLSDMETSIMSNVQTIVSTAVSKIRDYVDQEMAKMAAIVSDLNARLVTTESAIRELKTTQPSAAATELTTPIVAKRGLEEELVSLRATVSNHQHLLELHQRDERKNNLVVVGLDQMNDDENPLEVVTDLFTTKLDLSNLHPVRARRLGRKQDSKKRLMLITMASFMDKLAVLKARTRLKGTRIYVNEDLTPSQRQHHIKLLKMCRMAKSDGKHAYIRGAKLLVDGEELDSYTSTDSGDPVSLTHTPTLTNHQTND